VSYEHQKVRVEFQLSNASVAPVPVSADNPLPVTIAALGGLDDAAELDPAAETATTNALLRGLLTILADVYDPESSTIKTSSEPF